MHDIHYQGIQNIVFVMFDNIQLIYYTNFLNSYNFLSIC